MTEWNETTDGPRPAEPAGRDREIAALLASLDPASHDANYWFRFQSWVLDRTAPELARRRLMAELTMSEVLTSWARTVIPTAMLAAALAGLLLLRGHEVPAPRPMGVEEVLTVGVEGASIPARLRDEEAGSAVAFASEGF